MENPTPLILFDFCFSNSEEYFRYEKFSLDEKFPLLHMLGGKCSVFPSGRLQSRRESLTFLNFTLESGVHQAMQWLQHFSLDKPTLPTELQTWARGEVRKVRTLFLSFF